LGKTDFDKGDLKDELKNAGFEDCVADDIADRVNDRKTDDWTKMQGRKEAMKEIDMFINRSQQAYNNFRQRNMTATEKETLTSPL
jgi:hypothetical protein